ncbi:hypothetical protein H4S00_004968 [Coemansia sp. D1744]|nr:hypothetical protein H4S00_004968 [Coemansia sp. D1744]
MSNYYFRDYRDIPPLGPGIQPFDYSSGYSSAPSSGYSSNDHVNHNYPSQGYYSQPNQYNGHSGYSGYSSHPSQYYSEGGYYH